MNPIILDAPAIEKIIEQVNISSALRCMFVELAGNSAVQPPQTVTLFPNGRGDVISYQGVLETQNVFGTKLSPYIIGSDTNLVTAWTCLMSLETGTPLLLCDASQLTTERTAATTALAVDLLSKPESRKVAIIGSGSIAMAHWRHVKELRNWDSIQLWSPNLKNQPKRQADWVQLCPQVQLSSSVEQAIANADVILLCTSSGTPVIETDLLSKNTLVTSISTNVVQAHEVPPEFLLSAQVYCDYRETTPHSAGEMVIASRDHGWTSESLVGDLPELLVEKCAKPSSDAPIFFRSLGLGLEDVAMANEVYKVIRKS